MSQEYVIDPAFGTPQRISTPDELDEVVEQALTRAATGFPLLIQILTAADQLNGPTLAFGVGRSNSFLSFAHGQQAWSINGHPSGDDEPREWFDGSVDTEMFAKEPDVPLEVARQAARDFMRSGQLPDLPDGYTWVEADN